MAENENNSSKKNDGDEQLGENGLKALRSERSRANAAEKERDELQKKLDDAEAAQLSERDAAIKRAEKVEAERDALKSQLNLRDAKEKVLNDKAYEGYSDQIAKLIHGDDEKSLRESADTVLEILKGKDAPRAPKTDNQLGKDNEDNGNEDATALAALGFSPQ